MTLIIKTTGFSDYLAKSGGSYIKCLILGEPDSGKTRSASFWPDPVFADCENGRMSIADRQVPYGEIKSSKDMDALIARLRLECQKPDDKRVFRTLVIDTIDSYQRKLIAERLREERKEALSGWADWGFLDAKMTQLLDGALNLPMHVVVNLHVKDESDGDEDSRTLIKKSELKGAIKDQIAGQFDLVGYMEKSYVSENGTRTLKRQIRWHSEPRYPMAKDRSGRLPRFTDIDFTDNDFQRIYTAIVGDHMKDLPETGTFEELDTGEVEPAPPDLKGGPVDVEPIPGPRASLAKKAAAKKKLAPKPKAEAETETDAGDSSAPPAEDATETAPSESQPETRVENVDGVGEVNTDTGEIANTVSDEQAVENVKEQLDATEVEEPPAKASDDAYPDNPLVCGDQPAGAHRKHAAVPGCGKSLAEENRDQVNIALLRTHTLLCAACLTAWKASQ